MTDEIGEAERRGYLAGYEAGTKAAASEVRIVLDGIRALMARFEQRLGSPWFYRDEAFGLTMPDPQSPAPRPSWFDDLLKTRTENRCF